MRSANLLSLVRIHVVANGSIGLSRQPHDVNLDVATHQSKATLTRICLPSRRPKQTAASASSSSSSVAEFDDSPDDLDHVDYDHVKAFPPSENVRPFSEIPGPRGLPIIGTLWDYTKKKDGLKFSKMFEVMEMRASVFGPIYVEQFGHFKSVIISDPDEYAKVVRVDGKFPIRFPLEPLAHYQLKRGIGLGIGNGQGEEWYRHRAVVSKMMLRPAEVFKHIGPMNETATDFVRNIERKIRQKKKKENNDDDGFVVPDIEREIFKWTLESIGTVFFEERIGCLKDPPPQLALDFIDNLIGFFKYMQLLMYNFPFYKVFPTTTWKIYERYTDRVMEIGQIFVDKKATALNRPTEEEGVDEGKEKSEKSAFLTYLLSQKNLTSKEANTICVDLLLAAVDTTCNVLLFVLYCLSKNPSAQTTLYKETVDKLEDSDRITQEDLQSMHYVKACIRETFRLYPIVHATSRRITKDIEVCGYHVPAGTHCQANLYSMGRNPDLFPDPLRYQPERWLRENYGEKSKSLATVANLPFGHGPRMCVGRRLAEQELYLVVSKIVQRFKVEYSGEEDIQPVLNLFMTPDRPLKLTFTPRTTS